MPHLRGEAVAVTASASDILLAEIRDELRELRRLAEARAPDSTVDIDGAAAILHCTRRAVYDRRRRGKMPTPISAKPLVWRRADVLAMEA